MGASALQPTTYSIGNSIFGLMDYPTKQNEWSLEQKFASLAAKGYRHLEGDFGGYDAKQVRALAETFRFDIGCIRFGVRSIAQMQQLLQESLELNARYTVIIAGHSLDSSSKSVETIGAYLEMAAKEGMPLYVETHRDSATQDLKRLGNIVRQLPDMKLMVDLSHLLVSGEITDDLYDSYGEWLDPVLERAAGFHGRISNGEQIQVSIDSVHDEIAESYARLWQKGISGWKRSVDNDLPFRFTVELGPPPYALTVPAESGGRIELYDRLQQGDLLIELFKNTWNRAT
ncbi:sugar phosphate isomerase/epimerase family protein [Paenibacillus silvisoli]|uniref:sugar phosphate isomerase/epimerase family protein n=1 Tax=Paenibacillus silvisoli TaxID=3110539 RepID=UPI002806127D|nr:hypothetical protein [Paenibacillus silvisoli]